MPLEIDHIFVCTAIGAPEADRLIALGLTEGQPNTHPGQGTSNRRFFFRNAMLELLWIHDEREAQSPATERTRLFERWRFRDSSSCPFGLCFRSSKPSAPVPFSAWEYAPAYLPPSLFINIGDNSDVVAEPMLFHMSFSSRPDMAPADRRQPMEHRLGFRELTRVRWIRPDVGPISRELQVVLDIGAISIERGQRHTLEIGFDHESRGASISFSPEIPITLTW